DGTGSGGGGSGWWCQEWEGGYGGGGAGGSGVVVLRVWMNENDDPNPTGNFVAAEPTAADAVKIRYNLWMLGEGAQNCTVRLAYGLSPDALSTTNTLVTHYSAPGSTNVTINGFAPKRTYYAQLTIANDLEGTAPIVDSFSFTTPDESYPVGVNGKPGFYQSFVWKQWSDGFDIMADTTLATVSSAFAVYTTTDATWSGTNVANQTKVDYSWGSYLTFGYETYMYFDSSLTYRFYVNVDDYGSVWIDDAEFFRADGVGPKTDLSQQPSKDYIPSANGWKRIRLYAGNASGGYGAYDQIGWGISYSTDGGATVEKFVNDPASPKYKLANPGQVVVGGSSLVGGSIRTQVSFGADAVGGTYKVYAATAFGSTPGEWGVVASQGTVESAGTTSIVYEVPAQTRYVRIAVENGNDLYCDAAFLVSELPVVDVSRPSISVDPAGEVGADGATLSILVVACGGEASSVKAVVSYGFAGETLDFVREFEGLSVGLNRVRLSGLEPNHTYDIELYAENASGARSDTVALGTVSTGALPGYSNVAPGTPGYSSAGLWQACQSGVFSGTVEADPTVVRTLGTHAANVYWYPPNGYSPHWTVYHADGSAGEDTWKAEHTFAYSGYILLDDREYAFVGNVDDAVKLVIDGTEIFSGNGVRSGNFTPGRGAGWYRYYFEAIDWGGAAGNGGNFGHYFWNGSANQTVLDPGDGSLLRTQPGVKDGTVASYSKTVQGGLGAQIEFSQWQLADTVSLYLAYGKSIGGERPEDWEHTVLVSDSITAATSEYLYEGLSNAGVDHNYYHFYTKSGDNWQWTGDTLQIADSARPALSGDLAFDGGKGDSICVSGSVLSAGGEEPATLTFAVSASSDMSGAVEWEAGEYDSGDAIDFEMHTADTSSARYITPGSTYYVKATLTAAGGAKTITSVFTVETKAGASFDADAFVVSTLYATATFKFALSDAGAGDGATVYLLTGESADGMATVASQIVSNATVVHTFVYEYPAVEKTYYYAYIVSNGCESAQWEARSETMTVYPLDQYTYYWNPANHSGEWEDPANWTVDGNPVQATYPNARNCAAIFYTDDGNVGTPYEVSVSSAVRVSTFRIWWHGDMVLSLCGSGRNTASIEAVDGVNADYFATGSSITLKNMTYSNPGVFYLPPNITFTLDNVAATIGNQSMAQYANTVLRFKDSTVVQTGGNFYNHGDNFHWILDNSSFRITSGGCIRLSVGAATSGKCLVEFMGEAPAMYAMYHLFSVAEDGLNSAETELLFHVPAGGYATAPIRCTNDGGWEFQAGYGVLNIAVAADSSALKTPRSFTTSLVEVVMPGKFSTNLISFDSAYGHVGYDNEDATLATAIEASFERTSGMAVFVR
ncbi:MAG: hypothetical protein ILO34_04555, partial [Kiritimatiellae bacterium]|nr:hypothetical protein [Kiritimatiellia bacterium]